MTPSALYARKELHYRISYTDDKIQGQYRWRQDLVLQEMTDKMERELQKVRKSKTSGAQYIQFVNEVQKQIMEKKTFSGGSRMQGLSCTDDVAAEQFTGNKRKSKTISMHPGNKTTEKSVD
ncbi:hypothetical protein CHS0354_007039 [Potamilus streckersoni]|uniref:Uncharacterized protein n=1 Tax=Potamilus streckersoni TaxID=2493646 RepID=A0AAE0SCB7_9BIVA|nr:hypothetical protein CHS0354_007039 [Potamilus streckersoni]